MKTQVYISGRITGLTDEEVSKNFNKAEAFLNETEHYYPVNPLKLEHRWHDQSWSSFMKVDIQALCKCNAIYMLNNYKESKGALIELQLARDLGMKIIFEL